MKTCFKCNQAKPLTEFYRHKAMADGHLNKCKICTKSDVSAYRLKNVERVREYDRQRANKPHRVKHRARVAKSWKVAYPDRRAAQVALNNAVRDGLIHRQPCFVCGSAAEAHHPDYSRPLDVVWLCPPHHKQTHAMAFNLMREAA